MEQIITRLYELIKDTDDLIELEERVQQYMYELFEVYVGDVFTQLDKVMKAEKQQEGWKVKREDCKTMQFTFGAVQFRHTLMGDENGEPHYPFDEWMGFRKHQRYSPLVEVKVAEMASEGTYREVSRVLKEWTPVDLSHQSVGSIVNRVGEAQGEADEEMVRELEDAASLPEGEEVEFLYAEADGVFVRKTEKKKHHEVCHAVIHEGWEQNGKRVSLKNPKVIMTTQPTAAFWNEVQSYTAHHYSLEKTQVVTNSDGGQGYSAEKFQEAFSQSSYKVLNQLDPYHIAQGLNRGLGRGKSRYKDEIKKAIGKSDWDAFRLWIDTYESTLEVDEEIKKLESFRDYITRHWDRIFDWREKVERRPDDARSMGAMESNQRRVTYRMKKRGMHWSEAGAESMVKVKQGMLNETLRSVYLHHQHRSRRKQREVRRAVKVAQNVHQPSRPSIGVKRGSISLHTAQSSPIGTLMKSFR